MRDGKKNFKGKFWVSQHVRVELSWLPKGVDIFCDTGVIRSIHSKFLRTPNLTVIEYTVRMDKAKWCGLVSLDDIVRVDGEKLTPLDKTTS